MSEKQSELVQGAYASIKKLSRLSHSLLLLAKIENLQFDNIQRIDLKQKLEEKLEQFQELWARKINPITYLLSVKVLSP